MGLGQIRPRAAVLGGRGFLGRHAVAELEGQGVEVVVAGRDDGFDLSCGSQADLVAALRGWAPDVVVNATGRTLGTDDQLRRDNVTATDRLLRCCALATPGIRLVHLASAAEYGPCVPGVPVGVDDEPRPVGDYGRTKLEATRLVVAAGRRGSVDPVVLRVFNPLGAGQPTTTMPGTIAAQLARSPDGTIRVGVLDAWRDFVSAADVGRAVLAAAVVPAGRPGARVANIGSGRAVAVRQVARKLVLLAGGTARLEESGSGTSRSSEVSWQQADITATRQELGWTPRDDLPTALSAVLSSARSLAT
jgi:nucleoside-diphosphate-sugar epimerase